MPSDQSQPQSFFLYLSPSLVMSSMWPFLQLASQWDRKAITQRGWLAHLASTLDTGLTRDLDNLRRGEILGGLLLGKLNDVRGCPASVEILGLGGAGDKVLDGGVTLDSVLLDDGAVAAPGRVELIQDPLLVVPDLLPPVGLGQLDDILATAGLSVGLAASSAATSGIAS